MDHHSVQPLINKLQIGVRLSGPDVTVLVGAITTPALIPAGMDLIEEGDRPDRVHLILEGLACRYKLLSDGTRQILAWLIPGDICDLHVAVLGEMDHAIGTLSPCRVAYIARADVEGLIHCNAALNRALWWNTLVDEAILREWLVGMGRRSALAQTAHLFSELLVRFRMTGDAERDSYPLPITQITLADTLGISPVHVNRMLQSLRNKGLIRFEHGALTVLDEAELFKVGDFSPRYLHLIKRDSNHDKLDSKIGD